MQAGKDRQHGQHVETNKQRQRDDSIHDAHWAANVQQTENA